MAIRKPPYSSLGELLSKELVKEEESETADLIRSLRRVKKDRVLTKQELISICHWKSPRALLLIEQNHPATVRSLTRKAFATRSEQARIAYLTGLRGVGLPMASAILTLVDPKRYGVIDIRVWQLLFSLKSVRSNPDGIGFNFQNWYHYLCILRHHAKRLGVKVRQVERTIFLCHQSLQTENLYG
jgi:hypothetical protein